MALLNKLFGEAVEPQIALVPAPEPVQTLDQTKDETEHQELKSRVHNQLFDYIDLTQVGCVSEDRVAGEIAMVTRKILADEKTPLTREEMEQVVEEIQHEVFGLGPLEPLLQDPTISDILVNGFDRIYVERCGKLEKVCARFKDDEHLMRIIDKITSGVGRRIDELTPHVDARLPDGSRVHAINPPVAVDGPKLSIRRFAVDPLTHEDLVGFGTLTEGAVDLLRAIVGSRLNVLISGGTGAGKTTLLNVLSGFIPDNERVVTIEDSAELQLKQEHVVRLETRPANVEGRGAIAARDLVINSLRMRPDRIIVGEVRGSEALDMLQAMNTGHDGSLTTIHANSARDAITRIETMVAMTGLDVPQRIARQQIASAIQVVAQVTRLSDGSRRLESLMEITGMEGDVVSMSEILRFEREGIGPDGKIIGKLVPTGIRPQFCKQIREAGKELPQSIFNNPISGTAL